MTDTAAERVATRNGIALGMIGGAALHALGYLAWPDVADVAAPSDRLALAAWLSAAPALVVYAMFFSCLRLRDTPDAVNPLLGAESMRWKINQRALTNTVEQLAIFLPLLFALSVRVDAAHAKLLPLLVVGWTASRLAFWLGYRVSPAWRAPGMSWTHVTSIVTILWLARFTFA